MEKTPAHNCICQSCNKIFAVNQLMVCSFNFDKDEETSDSFVSYSLNLVTCPHCHCSFPFEMPMVIYSEKHRFAIYVSPSFDISSKTEIGLKRFIPNSLRFRKCTYQAEAVEKAIIFKDGLDDRYIEYIKLCFFNDSDALPFDKINLIYKSCDDENYYFEKIDYNNNPLEKYIVSKSEAMKLCEGISFENEKYQWKVVNRKTIKENAYV